MKKIFQVIIFCFGFVAFGQDQTGKMVETTNGFYGKILESINEEKAPVRTSFKMDSKGIDHPKSVSEFKTAWCESPESQGNTGTCWCFSTTSFFESEIFRLTQKKVELSELYVVYWEYVEKAREYVRTRGNSHFGEGSETNAVMRMMDKYGAMPLSAFKGIPQENKFHNHETMFAEMENHLHSLKASSSWDEETAIKNIKAILHNYIGKPADSFEYEGKTYTPKTFLKEVCQLNPNDYVDFMSLKEKPYNQQVEYDVPDNWWNSEEYYNVQLNDFMSIINYALENGYTLSIGGDVSETGYLPNQDIAYVADYDIPHKYINEDSRQLRFSNGATTDDHAIHLIGYKDMKNGRWYLVKDSGSGARNGENVGYMMYHESYVKLKMMTFTVHKDAAKKILEKFN